MVGMSVYDSTWQYVNSAETAKTNYLKDKWDRLYPGWNSKPQKEPSKIILPESVKP